MSSSSRQRILACSLLAWLVAFDASAQEHSITDLGLLHPQGHSYSAAINNRGEVTGTALAPNGLSEHGFFHDGSGMIDLTTLGGTYSFGNGLNDIGDIVGYSYVNALNLHAFLFSSGAMQDIHQGLLSFSRANAINRSGDVVGVMSVPGGFIADYRGFIYSGGVTTEIPTFGGDESQAFDVNERGQVVGFARQTPGKMRAFLYEAGVMTDLGDLGDGFARAAALNNYDRVVGLSRNSSGQYRGFVFEGGVMVDLGTLGGAESDARAVNKFGVVVGQAEDTSAQKRGVIRKGSALTDLNTEIPPGTGWLLTGANGINDLGQICGTGQLNGVQHAYRLDPLAELPRTSGLVPSLTGAVNTIHVFGATPGQPVFLLAGTGTGSLQVPGCAAGTDVKIGNFFILAVGNPGVDGRYDLDVFVPPSVAGLKILFQAIDLNGCGAGAVVEDTIL